MSWDDTKDLKKTLIILRRTVGGQTAYTIYPYMRITRPTGETYMSLLPNRGFINNPGKYNFSSMEVIDDKGMGGDTDIGMNYSNPDTAVGLTYG